jgi:CRP-like cAMP-binding protein
MMMKHTTEVQIMTTQSELKILTVLRSMEVLHGLEASHVKKLASIAREMQFPEGEIIYRPGDIGQAIYLIQTGQVIIEMEVVGYGQVTVYTVEPGQLFGWSALFPPRRKSAQARVAKPTWAIVIPADQLLDLFHRDHNLEFAFTKRITETVVERMKATRLQLAKVYASGNPA